MAGPDSTEKCRHDESSFWCVEHGSDWLIDEACEEVLRRAEADFVDRELQRAKDERAERALGRFP